MKSSTLANTIAKLALTKKAQDVVIMDLRPLTSMTDYFVVCSADSDIQVKAIADAVLDGTEAQGIGPWHQETKSHNWKLLDFSDVVLHIFHKTSRTFYNLERLWGDAKMKYVRDETPVPKQPKPVSQKSVKPKKKAGVQSTKHKPARKKTAR